MLLEMRTITVLDCIIKFFLYVINTHSSTLFHNRFTISYEVKHQANPFEPTTFINVCIYADSGILSLLCALGFIGCKTFPYMYSKVNSFGRQSPLIFGLEKGFNLTFEALKYKISEAYCLNFFDA